MSNILIQCDLITFKFNASIDSLFGTDLKNDSNDNDPRLLDIGTQTQFNYSEDNEWTIRKDLATKFIDKFPQIIDTFTHHHYDFLKQIIKLLNQMSLKELNSLKMLNYSGSCELFDFQNLIDISLNNIEPFKELITNFESLQNENENLDYKDDIKILTDHLLRVFTLNSDETETDNNKTSKKETKKYSNALSRFRKAVLFVKINREWSNVASTENKENKRQREKLLIDYHNKIEKKLGYINAKKAQILFNKDEFKAAPTISSIKKNELENTNNTRRDSIAPIKILDDFYFHHELITNVHRRILSKDKLNRSLEHIEILLDLIRLIPKLNTFPRHISYHIAQIIQLVTYPEGCVIVREGHEPINFYYIISGSCKVFINSPQSQPQSPIVINNLNLDGMKLFDEFYPGDIFGERSFELSLLNSTSSLLKTPSTVITTQRTELLMIEPADIIKKINEYSLNDKKIINHFLKNWTLLAYWLWNDEHFANFSNTSQLMRFSRNDLIFTTGVYSPIEYLYFIETGQVELIHELYIPYSVLRKNSNPADLKELESRKIIDNFENQNIESLKNKIKKRLSIGILEKYNYFGCFYDNKNNDYSHTSSSSNSISTSNHLTNSTSQQTGTHREFRAFTNDVTVIKISKNDFLSANKYAVFLLSKLIDHYNLSIPSQAEVVAHYEKQLMTRQLKKLFKSQKIKIQKIKMEKQNFK
jgi:CRP-like cAMP-binding protein